jgi:hypothetical protein
VRHHLSVDFCEGHENKKGQEAFSLPFLVDDAAIIF